MPSFNRCQAEYARLRRGDLSAVSHITGDRHFARQLALEVDLEENGKGNTLSMEDRRAMNAHREAVTRTTVPQIENEREL